MSEDLVGLRDALDAEIGKLDAEIEGPEREREKRRAELAKLRRTKAEVDARITAKAEAAALDAARKWAEITRARYKARALALIHQALRWSEQHEALRLHWDRAIDAAREVQRLGGQTPAPAPEYLTGSSSPVAAALATLEKILHGSSGAEIGVGQWGREAWMLATERVEAEGKRLREDMAKGVRDG